MVPPRPQEPAGGFHDLRPCRARTPLQRGNQIVIQIAHMQVSSPFRASKAEYQHRTPGTMDAILKQSYRADDRHQLCGLYPALRECDCRLVSRSWERSMAVRILVFYGSYRSDRMGIRLVDYVVAGLRARGGDVEFVDAKAIGLPMLDRMYKEYPPGSAPEALESLASK